ncbi:MAG: DUF2934 domain-containing protein [Acidobacteriota bacterium]|nr:DUF2934 domain-containing protein [Acidobacteriota bacterium]
MAKKNTVISEVASAFGAAAARVENLKQNRTATAKHSKASVAVSDTEPTVTEAVTQAPAMSETEEIAQVAYQYSAARGFQGGSPEEDWLRAEQDVRNRKRA